MNKENNTQTAKKKKKGYAFLANIIFLYAASVPMVIYWVIDINRRIRATDAEDVVVGFAVVFYIAGLVWSLCTMLTAQGYEVETDKERAARKDFELLERKFSFYNDRLSVLTEKEKTETGLNFEEDMERDNIKRALMRLDY